ncbi:MAG: hypothetical protein ABIG96_06985 [Candidatus Micrarchaeota archaeon]
MKIEPFTVKQFREHIKYIERLIDKTAELETMAKKGTVDRIGEDNIPGNLMDFHNIPGNKIAVAHDGQRHEFRPPVELIAKAVNYSRARQELHQVVAEQLNKRLKPAQWEDTKEIGRVERMIVAEKSQKVASLLVQRKEIETGYRSFLLQHYNKILGRTSGR